MKYSINKLSILSILILMLGCQDDLLNLEPQSFQNASSFFNTADQFDLAIMGAYNPLLGMHTGTMWAMAEMRSDNTSSQYHTNERSGFHLEMLDEFRMEPVNTIASSFYNGSYTGISRANVIIGRVSDADFNDQTKNLFAGEAKFLRAFYYFNLVRFFGDVPVYDGEVISTSQAISTGRTPVSQVYELIESDLNDAIAFLPEERSPSEKGRATKGAARTMLAKVYMTNNNFSAAVDQLRAINGYSLLPEYAAVFETTNKNHVESIFEIQYLEGPFDTHSNFIYTFMPYNSNDEITGFLPSAGAAAGWNIPTQDMLDAYEPNDIRKNVSIQIGYTTNAGQTVELPYIIKYLNPHQVRFQTNDNWPVYRYADVMLMLAECLNEQGFVANGEAFDLMNTVRARAGLPPKTAGNPDPSLNVNTQQVFREAVWQERRVELAFENHRWFDLLRTNRAVEVLTAHGEQEKSLKNTLFPGAFDNIKLLYPIPQRELDLDENLSQNPGYN